MASDYPAIVDIIGAMPSSSGRSGRDKTTRETGGQSQHNAGKRRAGRRKKQGQAGNRGENPGESGPDTAQPADPQRGPATAEPVRRSARRLPTVEETSAGGLVVDSANSSAALIGRLDRRGRLLWSLPKGHLEEGETAEQAAVREVAEETGIAAAVVAALGSIDYWFVAEDRRVHKTVHHFLLRAHGGELSDADVEVTAVAWVPLPELQQRLAYADERRLVQRATELLADPA